MIGLILLYFVGTWFYRLAEEFGKSKAGYLVLGITCYYGSASMVSNFMRLAMPEFVTISDLTLKLILNVSTFPVAVIVCWGLASALRSVWSKADSLDDKILDANVTT